MALPSSLKNVPFYACGKEGGLGALAQAYPPLKGCAKLFRRAMPDWIVVGSGSNNVPGLRSPSCRCERQIRVPK
jgi:hypothetical protein